MPRGTPGLSSDDEVNIIERGRNYGWPDVVGFCETPEEIAFCAEHNVREPLHAWTPTLAVAGIDHYHHQAITEWQNCLLMTTLKASTLYALKLNDEGTAITEVTEYFKNTWGRLRDVCIAPNGDVYLAVSNRDGRGTPKPGDDRIVRLRPANTTGLNQTGHTEKSLFIYPNPVSADQTLRINELYSGMKYQILNYNGELIGGGQIPASAAISIGNSLAKGIYLLRVITSNSIKSGRFLII
ncbi:hypothetical protein MASR1M74_01710 [Lentimicrobium sp.]